MVNKNEIISRTTYATFIHTLLVSLGGVATKEYIQQRIETQFAKEWTAADRRLKKVFKYGQQPVWKNELDWAIVQAGRQRLFFHKQGVLVANSKQHQSLIADWIQPNTQKKNDFLKYCKKCLSPASLNSEICEKCDTFFPAGTKRREVKVKATLA